MSLEQELFGQLPQAMKEKDNLRVNTLRLLKAAIKNREVELQRKLEDDEILRLIRTQVKQHDDAIRQFHEGGRNDLVTKEEAELAILMSFLPEQLSPEAISREVSSVIEELGAKDMKDVGRVMKAVMAKLAASADGRLVNEIVRRQLSALISNSDDI
jgi:uncharacterized protein YqeY